MIIVRGLSKKVWIPKFCHAQIEIRRSNSRFFTQLLQVEPRFLQLAGD